MGLKATIAESCRSLRRRWRANRGSAAIEFALVAPVFFLFLFGIIETGVIYFGTAMIQNATDDTARMVRTGQLSGTLTSDQLVTQVCSEVTGLITAVDCKNNLKVDLRSYTNFGGSSYPSVTKPDGTIDPNKIKVENAADCSVVLFRTFYPWTIMTPLMSALIENTQTGQYMLSASAAFRTEPYTSSSTC
ncbi:MAG TPA: TadE/TadG family type IV pilus assembly protein [Rhizomicrobium sp.]|nr:TadE/TadG family type IV pilus assembly protein [Rhizomicrobium sp.]